MSGDAGADGVGWAWFGGGYVTGFVDQVAGAEDVMPSNAWPEDPFNKGEVFPVLSIVKTPTLLATGDFVRSDADVPVEAAVDCCFAE